MKSCPSCNQTYPDDGPDFCVNDGTPLVKSERSYNPGAAPGGPWQAPPPQGWGYPPPSQYGSGSPSDTGGLATTALIMGITAVVSLVLGFILSASASTSYYGGNFGVAKFAAILFMLMFLTGLTAFNLGLVSLSLAGGNSGRRAKSIIGICLGIIPFLMIVILFMASGPRFRF